MATKPQATKLNPLGKADRSHLIDVLMERIATAEDMFISTATLLKIYLLIAQLDTKSPTDLEEAILASREYAEVTK